MQNFNMPGQGSSGQEDLMKVMKAAASKKDLEAASMMKPGLDKQAEAQLAEVEARQEDAPKAGDTPTPGEQAKMMEEVKAALAADEAEKAAIRNKIDRAN